VVVAGWHYGRLAVVMAPVAELTKVRAGEYAARRFSFATVFIRIHEYETLPTKGNVFFTSVRPWCASHIFPTLLARVIGETLCDPSA
jgi:hypothetical protein